MKTKEILKNVFLIEFDTQRELASSFLRFSEYDQNPKFKGKTFTLEEFKKWYIPNSPNGRKTQEFTYYKDWDGFSIQSKTLLPFYKEKFNPLSKEEQAILNQFSKIKNNNFYIIGTFGQVSTSTYNHEIAHGLFNTRPEYKKKVLNIMKEIPKEDKKKLDRFLATYGGGYHPDFFDEEGHCYLLDLRCLASNGVKGKYLSEANKKLKIVFDEFYNKL